MITDSLRTVWAVLGLHPSGPNDICSFVYLEFLVFSVVCSGNTLGNQLCSNTMAVFFITSFFEETSPICIII